VPGGWLDGNQEKGLQWVSLKEKLTMFYRLRKKLRDNYLEKR
jgi:hypothetical protein